MEVHEFTKLIFDNKEWLFSGIGAIVLFELYKKILAPKLNNKTIITEEAIKQKKIRDKAHDIDKNTLPIFKRLINDLRIHMNDKTYIAYDNLHSLTFKIDSNIFIDNLGSSDIFKVENDKLILTYKQDEDLNRHMQTILGYINEYHKNASKLKTVIETIFEPLKTLSNSNSSFIIEQHKKSGFYFKISDFNRNLNSVVINEFGKERVSKSSPMYKDICTLYFIAMTGSKNAYKSGHVFVIELLKNRFEDLQSAIVKNDEDAQTIKEIKEELRNIKFNLDSAYDEIQKLHEVWQNKLIL